MSLDIVSLGEVLIRFSPSPGHVLESAPHFEVLAAGAEANVAATASRMGHPSGWISRLPDTPLGRRAAESVRIHGVDISQVVWTASGRMGTYYIDSAAPPRLRQVIYDRAGSAVTDLTPDDVNWDYIRSARIFHVTGITLALSPSLREVVDRSLETVHESGGLVSFDLNYRAKLWSAEAARAAIEPRLQHCDILRAGLEEAREVLGVEGSAAETARQLKKASGASVVVITNEGRSAAAYDGSLYERVPSAVTVVDAIGAGDAFTAGFLCGYLEHGTAFGLELAVALGTLKLTYAGDIAWCTRAEVEAFMERKQEPPR